MTTPTEGEQSETPQFSEAELASIAVAQQGITEPTGVNQLPAGDPQRPDYLPEQFWKDGKADYEGLAKSYAALRSKMDGGEQQAQEENSETPAEPAVAPDGKLVKPEAPDAPSGNEALTTAIEAARTEFASGGEVSEETVAALETAGIPKEIFALYLEGVKAVTAQGVAAIHGFVGGEDNYNAMAEWASKNLTDAELDAFNEALDKPDLRENAVRGLFARYETARPSEGKLLTPAGTPAQAGDVYSTRDQLVADQRDPRYQSDPAFRQQVMDKLVRSQKTGFQVVARPMFEREVYTR